MTGADGCGCDRGCGEADGRVVAVAVAQAALTMKDAVLEHGCFHGIAIVAWLRWRHWGLEAAAMTAHGRQAMRWCSRESESCCTRQVAGLTAARRGKS